VLGLADQYSLGCVLYECLTGRVPFEKDLDAAIIWAHVEETPTMPSVLRPELPPQIDDVFRRVLAKRPDERYGSCREFVDAARVALGILGPETRSSLPYGPGPGGPRTGAPVSSRAVAMPDGFSWSRASQPRAADLVGPVAPGPPASAPPPAGRPRDRRWYRRPGWLAALAAVILVAAGLGTWAGLNAAGSHAKSAMNMPSMSAAPKHTPAPSALMNALILANNSADAKGQLPPSTCKQDNPTRVTCTAPAAGISGVVFQTYPSLKALYAAYTAKVASVNSGQFRQNFSDCGAQDTYGEVGWNHQFHHTRAYSVDQMTMGMVKDDQAAGRVFCNYTQGLESMVWTQNDGRLMGYVAGPVHANVWTWWVAVHHNIGISGAPMHM
jgi:hypothetical protein